MGKKWQKSANPSGEGEGEGEGGEEEGGQEADEEESHLSLLAEIGSLDDDDGMKTRKMRFFILFLEKALSRVTDFHRGRVEGNNNNNNKILA